MDLTDQQKLLINGLKLFGVDMDETARIVVALQKPEQIDRLMLWMADNLKATPSDIIGKVIEIMR